jgi:metallo-beta-lactamase family protein
MAYFMKWRSSMKLQFLGAAQTVTGSRYLLSTAGTKILIDCGLFQGFKHLRLKNWENFPFDPRELDAVFLTHAHLDHSGAIPLLFTSGYRGPVFCTNATRDLCRIMLTDSGHLQEEEARHANLKGYSKHHPARPLYTENDARQSLSLLRNVEWKTDIPVKDFTVRFTPAGHLLGAASVYVQGPGSDVVFSGDLGRTNDAVMQPPETPPAARTLVMESTYGDRLHPFTDPETELKDIVNTVLGRQGTVVIPCFAVGRAQTILYYMYRLKQSGLIPDVPVYLNSPMAKEVNGTFRQYAGEHKLNAELAAAVCNSARVVSSVEESIRMNESRAPKVIIAASGMASGGRVLHHLKTYAPDPRSGIVFVGFQAGGTRGDAMVTGAEQVKIHGQYWPIRASVYQIDSLSAHADSNGLLEWVRAIDPKPERVFLTHGEPAGAEALRIRLQEELGVVASVPEMMSTVELP